MKGAAEVAPFLGGKAMLKLYRMPNGRIYQYDEKDVPAGAVLIEKEAPVKKAAPKNKAVVPKNKAVKK